MYVSATPPNWSLPRKDCTYEAIIVPARPVQTCGCSRRGCRTKSSWVNGQSFHGLPQRPCAYLAFRRVCLFTLPTSAPSSHHSPIFPTMSSFSLFLGLSFLVKSIHAQQTNAFISPPSAGPPQFYSDNLVFTVGEEIEVRWSTNINQYSIALWQQSLGIGIGTPGPNVYSTPQFRAICDQTDTSN